MLSTTLSVIVKILQIAYYAFLIFSIIKKERSVNSDLSFLFISINNNDLVFSISFVQI